MDVSEETRRSPSPDGPTSRDIAADWAAVLVLAGFAILVLVLATPLASFSTFGPGPGFFAQYLGATLFGLVMVQLAMLSMRTLRARGRGIPTAPDGSGTATDISRGDVARFVVMAAALFAYPLLLRPIGFVAATAAMSWILLAMLGRTPIRAAIEAVVSVIVLKLVFTRLLDVPLPSTPVEFLARFGL